MYRVYNIKQHMPALIMLKDQSGIIMNKNKSIIKKQIGKIPYNILIILL